MNSRQQKQFIAKKFGSKTGKLKKKHIFRAKASLSSRLQVDATGKISVNVAALTEDEIKELTND